MQLIPGKLYLSKEKMAAINTFTDERERFPANTILFLISNCYAVFGELGKSPEFLKIKFLYDKNIYETEIYDNASFYFSDL